MSRANTPDKQTPGQEPLGTHGGFARTPGVRVLGRRLRRSHSADHSCRLRGNALFSLLVIVVVYMALVTLVSLCMYLRGRGGAAGLSKVPFPVASVTRRLANGSQEEASGLTGRCERLWGGLVSSGEPNAPAVPSSGGSGGHSETPITNPAAGLSESDGNPEEDAPFDEPPPSYDETVRLMAGNVAVFSRVVHSGRGGESPPPPYESVVHAPQGYTSVPPPPYDDTFIDTETPYVSRRYHDQGNRSVRWVHYNLCCILTVVSYLVMAIIFTVLSVQLVKWINQLVMYVPTINAATGGVNASTGGVNASTSPSNTSRRHYNVS